MADERPGQRAGDDVRRPARRRRLVPGALTTLVLFLAACNSDTTAPDRGAGLPFGEASSGGGSAGGDAPDNSSGTIVGEWERFEAVAFDGDFVTTTIHWLFDADGTCVRVITSTSANEGIPRTEVRECTWRIGPAEITLALGTDPETTFPLEFGGFDPDRMILDGLEYQRIR